MSQVSDVYRYLEVANYKNTIDLTYENIEILQHNLRTIRKTAKISSEKIGEIINVSGQSILNFESGKYKLTEDYAKAIFAFLLQEAKLRFDRKDYFLLNILIGLFNYGTKNNVQKMTTPEQKLFIEDNIFLDKELLSNTYIFDVEKYKEIGFPEAFIYTFEEVNLLEWIVLDGNRFVDAVNCNIRNLRTLAGLSVEAVMEKLKIKEKVSYTHYELKTYSFDIKQVKLFIDLLYSVDMDKTPLLEDSIHLLFCSNYATKKDMINSCINEAVQLESSEINCPELISLMQKYLKGCIYFAYLNEELITFNDFLRLQREATLTERTNLMNILKESCVTIEGMSDFCVQKNLFSEEDIYKLKTPVKANFGNDKIEILISNDSFSVNTADLDKTIAYFEKILGFVNNKQEFSESLKIKEGMLCIEKFGLEDKVIDLVSTIKKDKEISFINYPCNKYHLIRIIDLLKSNR